MQTQFQYAGKECWHQGIYDRNIDQANQIPYSLFSPITTTFSFPVAIPSSSLVISIIFMRIRRTIFVFISLRLLFIFSMQFNHPLQWGINGILKITQVAITCDPI